MPRRTERLFCRFREVGDARALGAVFDRTAPELLRVALHLTGDRHRAEDAVQSTFLTAIEKAGQWNRERRLLPWLLAILANRVRTMYRGERRALPLPADGAVARGGDVADRAAAREFEATCDAAIARLGEPYRQVLLLHLRHGLAAIEIARVLERPDSTVRNQIARGLDLLRAALPAGIASGLAVVAASGRGLAAVRASVLARAPAGASAIAVSSLSMVGVVAMSKKAVGLWIVLPLLAAAAGGVGYAMVGAGAPPEAAVPPEIARAQGSVEGERPETGSAASTEQADPPARRVAVAAERDTGDLRVQVVVKGTGEPAVGVNLETSTMSGEERGPSQAVARTDAGGEALFADHPPGRYSCDVRLGSAALQRDVEIVADRETTLRVAVPRGWSVRGVVVDRDGRPAPDVEVRALGESNQGYVLARTAGDGSFAAHHLLAELTLWALAPGLQPSKRVYLDRRAGTAEIRLVLGEPGTRLVGRVEDETGRPAARAQVGIGIDVHAGSHFIQRELHELQAGDDGAFAVDWLPSGKHFVGARPADGDRARATALWVESSTAGPAQVVLRLGAGATIEGRVVDAQGEPVVGVVVSASFLDESGLGPFDWAYANSADDGGFKLAGLLAGRHRLHVSRDGHPLVEAERTLRARQTVSWTPVLSGHNRVAVRVLDAAGEPMPGWTVEARRRHEQLPHLWRTRTAEPTGVDGECAFADLPAGEYEVRVVTANRVGCVDVQKITVPRSGAVELRIDEARLPSARLSGRVVDARGVPMTDASLYLSPGGGGHLHEVRVDRDGHFDTGLLPPGEYRLNARSPREEFTSTGASHTLEVGDHRDLGDVVLGDAATLAVRVVRNDGAELAGVSLRADLAVAEWPSEGGLQRDEVDGVFRKKGLPPGRYLLRFLAENAAAQTVPVTLAAGEVREFDLVAKAALPVAIELRCAQTVGGMLNGLLTIDDAGGAQIVCHRLWPYFDDFENRIEWVKLALPPGTYRVHARVGQGDDRGAELVVPAGGLEKPFILDLR